MLLKFLLASCRKITFDYHRILLKGNLSIKFSKCHSQSHRGRHSLLANVSRRPVDNAGKNTGMKVSMGSLYESPFPDTGQTCTQTSHRFLITQPLSNKTLLI